MTARIIDGKAVAAELRQRVAEAAQAAYGSALLALRG